MLEFNALLGGKVSVHDMRVAVFFVVLKRHFRFSHIHKKELAKKCFLENHLLLSGGKNSLSQIRRVHVKGRDVLRQWKMTPPAASPLLPAI